jgi:GH15 family glucan-1,4-alpha-glucosidase
VECAALGGDLPAATAAFEGLLACGNDLGLFAEEIEADTGAPLGNFPQAFTHVGLINAALTLSERRAPTSPRPPGGPAVLDMEDRA